MLALILGLLALFFCLSMLIGLVNPAAVLPGKGRPSRITAFGVYFVLTAIFLAGAWATTDRKEDIRRLVMGAGGDRPLPAGPSEFRDPVTAPSEVSAWCDYRKGLLELDREAGTVFGVDPRRSWKQGQVVAIEKDTRLSPAMPDKFKNEEELEKAARESRRIKAGERVKVLAVSRDQEDRLWYKVEVLGKGASGYIGEHHLFWYDSSSRRGSLHDERESWLEAGRQRLRQQLFTDRSLDFDKIAARATEGKWNEQCGVRSIEIR